MAKQMKVNLADRLKQSDFALKRHLAVYETLRPRQKLDVLSKIAGAFAVGGKTREQVDIHNIGNHHRAVIRYTESPAF